MPRNVPDEPRKRTTAHSGAQRAFRPPRAAAGARAHDRRLLFWRRPVTRYYYFSEQPYTAYDPRVQDDYPSLRLTLPNSLFDPVAAADLYNRYHDEYQVV